ncbi:MAG: T9SS type A sorting domain-containing protein [Flavobacteriales bacterium]|nr:T9SS type A sorting domain-containing protein [Flavobacteriales bacterium]
MKNVIGPGLRIGSFGPWVRAYFVRATVAASVSLVAMQGFGQFLSYMKSFGGPNEEFALHVLPVNDAQGGHILVGQTGSYGQAAANTSPNAYILRTDESGSRLWSISAGGSGYDYLNMVAETTDGWLVVGATVNSGGLYSDVLLMRISTSGALIWTKRIGTPEQNEVGDHILALGGDQFMITGSRFITGGGSDGDVFVMKINGQGEVLWSSLVGSDRQDDPNAITTTADGGFLIAGTRTTLPTQQAFLFKLDGDGGLVWERTWQALQGSVTITRLIPSADGGSILTGQSSGLQVMKLDDTGDVVWSRAYQQGAYISGVSLGSFGEDGYLIVGATSNPDFSLPRMMALRIDGLGEVVEARSYAGDLGNANGRSAVVEAEGGITMVGSLSTGGGDVLLVRTQVGDDGLGALCNEQQETVTTTTPVAFNVVNGLYAALNPISPVTSSLSWVVNSSTTETTYCSNVSVPELQEPAQQLIAFPNPTAGPLTIQWPSWSDHRLVELMDSSGRVVLSTRAHGSATLDVSMLAGGPYIVRVSNDRSVLYGVFMVQ